MNGSGWSFAPNRFRELYQGYEVIQVVSRGSLSINRYGTCLVFVSLFLFLALTHGYCVSLRRNARCLLLGLYKQCPRTDVRGHMRPIPNGSSL